MARLTAMDKRYKDFAPYYRNGRLFIPARTLTMLREVGLDERISMKATRGLDLTSQRDEVAVINQAMENLLSHLAEDTLAFEVLTSPTTRFYLTGKPALTA
jgi:hypothetical protein